jgi:hypothetical protein
VRDPLATVRTQLDIMADPEARPEAILDAWYAAMAASRNASTTLSDQPALANLADGVNSLLHLDTVSLMEYSPDRYGNMRRLSHYLGGPAEDPARYGIDGDPQRQRYYERHVAIARVVARVVSDMRRGAAWGIRKLHTRENDMDLRCETPDPAVGQHGQCGQDRDAAPAAPGGRGGARTPPARAV